MGVALLILVLVQTLLIGIVLRQRGRRKRAEQAVSESEKRFRLFMDHSPAIAWMKDGQGHYVYMNESYLKQLGVRLEDRLGKTDYEVYPRETAEQFRENDKAALAAGHSIEFAEESIRPDGKTCFWLAYKFPFREASGQLFVGGIAVDIAEQKTLEESLRAVSGRLIHAQEEERARIARELHDDFSQRVVILGMGLERLRERLPKSEVEGSARVQEMLEQTQELSADIHSLSHQLHPTILEHIGLVSALQELCKEIGGKYKMEVQFTKCDPGLEIPKDTVLCLFRVAQEALGNIVKHSQAKRVQVELGTSSSGLNLRIRDDGRGFESELKGASTGIGLIGMQERIRLVGGRLLVKSQPNCGTEIIAEAPLCTSKNAAEIRVQTAGQ